MKSNTIISHDWQDLSSILDGRKVVVIYDGNVPSIPSLDGFQKIVINASEGAKTLASVEKIVSQLLEIGADRDVFILGVGGGITTDLTGFVASIYKRGVAFGFVPTTLLAQVDAAVGGKNGVNFFGFKNMLGVIRQPEFVFINPDVLESLSDRLLRCGMAEVLKSFIISDREMFLKAAQQEWKQNLEPYIRRAVEIKCSIVEQDETERGLRRVLNLGHTFAHAIEHSCGMMHGEAVAAGTCIASGISRSLGLLADAEYRRIVDTFERTGLPVRCNIPFAELEQAVAQDKKMQDGYLNFVLPLKIGEVCVRKLTMEQIRDGYGLL